MYLSAMYITAISCFLFAYFAFHGHHTPSARDSISGSKTDEKKKKVDQEVKGIYIILSNISKGTPFLHQDVTNCGLRKTWHIFVSLLDQLFHFSFEF